MSNRPPERQTYLVETYVPRLGEASCREASCRARTAADELSRSGTSVRYLCALFAAEDETCFHVFEASSIEAVAEASRKAALTHGRIVPVTVNDEAGRKEPSFGVLKEGRERVR